MTAPALFPAPIAPWAVGPQAWFYALFIGAFIPWAAWRSRGRVLALEAWPSRIRRFQSGLFVQLWMVTIALLVAWRLDIRLFPARVPSPLQIAAGIVIVAGLTALMRPRWRQAVERRSWRVHFFMPRTAPERGWWVVNSVAAGVCEEIVYRGVLTSVLAGLLHGAWTGVVVSALAFGLAHSFQTRFSMTVIVLIAAALQMVTWWTGALWLAMGIHAVYDVIAGFSYGRLGERLGYPAEGIPIEEARLQSAGVTRG
ncbi:MAG: CPBP family intramembrane glutamic endopeptidase [Candidatus Eisenbacteria bacterium]